MTVLIWAGSSDERAVRNTSENILVYQVILKLVQRDSINVLKIVSDYDQVIPQSQTADNAKAPRGRATQPSRDTRKTKLSKANTSLFLSLFYFSMKTCVEGLIGNVSKDTSIDHNNICFVEK